jgi:ubiquinone/menaquinone biosynthesis C-methylase UbiE
MPLADRRILDIGCGDGSVLALFAKWGALPKNLFGVDLVPEHIDTAERKFPGIQFRLANAEHLDFEANFFDLVLFFKVFTAILDDNMARNVAREAARVLKPSGVVVWYDFRYNNPYNHNVRPMTKDSIHMLFPNFDLKLRTLTLFPPLARRLGRATPVLYPILSGLPWLTTHYAGIFVKPAARH